MAETSTTGQKVAAEAIGTFVLVFLGCGAVITTRVLESSQGLVTVPLAFGLALVAGTYAFGRVSGAHLNPAVSLGAALSGRMAWAQLPLYAAAQVAGGFLAAGALLVLTQAFPEGTAPADEVGQNRFGDGGFAWWGALLLEIVLTAIFVLVVLAVTDARHDHTGLAPLTIGLTFAAVYLFAFPLTGGSVNPARSIGPAIFSGVEALKDLWVFVVAPLVGAAAAGLAYPALFGAGSDPVPGSGLSSARRVKAPAPAPAPVPAPQPAWDQGGGWNPAAQPAPTGYAAPHDPTTSYPAPQDQAVHDPAAVQAYAAQPGWDQEPIIQDGWQWDHQAQEWKPLQEWPAPQPAVESTTAFPADPAEPTQPFTASGSSFPGPVDHDDADPLESRTVVTQSPRAPAPPEGDPLPPPGGPAGVTDETQIRPHPEP